MCRSNLEEKVLFQEQSLPVPLPPLLGLAEVGVGDRPSLGICWPVAELVKTPAFLRKSF